jgi:hypothetical protein
MVNSYSDLVEVEGGSVLHLKVNGGPPKTVSFYSSYEVSGAFKDSNNEITGEALLNLIKNFNGLNEEEELDESSALLVDIERFEGDWAAFTNSHPLLATLAAVDPATVTMGFARLAALMVVIHESSSTGSLLDGVPYVSADEQKSSDSC